MWLIPYISYTQTQHCALQLSFQHKFHHFSILFNQLLNACMWLVAVTSWPKMVSTLQWAGTVKFHFVLGILFCKQEQPHAHQFYVFRSPVMVEAHRTALRYSFYIIRQITFQYLPLPWQTWADIISYEIRTWSWSGTILICTRIFVNISERRFGRLTLFPALGTGLGIWRRTLVSNPRQWSKCILMQWNSWLLNSYT